MDIRLIAVDLDDTLMRPDKSISDYTISVLRRRSERGIRLCFVTARSLKASERASNLTSPEYIVSCGGALCTFGDKKLLQVTLTKNEANDIVTFCRKLSSIQALQAETIHGDYFVSFEPGTHGDYASAQRYNFENSLPCDVYKLVISIADPVERQAMIDAFPNARAYNYVGGASCFVAAKGATKLRGLECAAAHMGITLAEVAAVGDDVGDADYIAACGYGVAVENAVTAAKSAARYRCPSNADDGVARWLEANVL